MDDPVAKPSIQTETRFYTQRIGKAFNLTARIGLMSGSWAAGFQTYLPPNGCKVYNKVSVSAKEGGCTYATNGGFFNTTSPGCLADLIVDGKIYSITDAVASSVALRASDKKIIFGYVNPQEIKSTAFLSLMSGHVWLVRKGQNYVNVSAEKESVGTPFLREAAPRTAIGARADGTLISLQVDGVEELYKGPDLWLIADIMIQLGAVQAINVDGGGSSEAWYDGKVINTPNCADNGVFCERPLTSIICLKA
eukprot:TRINITY_DN2340_c0_g1_i3.p1 TRINITY_DN2340_c0_g1~~TRINITY_DN2340_c0_g1_i3.p1  ORF type:complete len:288 (-),score=45.81 TRINITY_DN2340_c0_g1_i3:34-786(-)